MEAISGPREGPCMDPPGQQGKQYKGIQLQVMFMGGALSPVFLAGLNSGLNLLILYVLPFFPFFPFSLFPVRRSNPSKRSFATRCSGCSCAEKRSAPSSSNTSWGGDIQDSMSTPAPASCLVMPSPWKTRQATLSSC